MKWLENQGFGPNAEYALSRKVGAEKDDPQPERSVIRIQNLGARRKYFYTLYSAEKPVNGYGMAAKRDEGYRSHALSGAETYEIHDFSQNIPGELNKPENWMYAPQTEQEITAYLPAVMAGEYVRVNELLEKWFYGGEPLEPDEIRVLYAFLRKIKTVIDRRHRYDWMNAGVGRLLRRARRKKHRKAD